MDRKFTFDDLRWGEMFRINGHRQRCIKISSTAFGIEGGCISIWNDFAFWVSEVFDMTRGEFVSLDKLDFVDDKWVIVK